jgi:ABC-type bacteriocin/lantibiotic exporter with double-glycine peptidase domain
VLDEATNALDEHTESSVLSSIGDLRGRVTIIIVAHRASTIRECDHLIHIANGRAVPVNSDYRLSARLDGEQELL